MQISVSGRHFEVTDNVKSYATEKMERLERFAKGIETVDVVLKEEDRTNHCEIIVHVKNSKSIVVDVAHEEMFAAIDLALDKAERQLRRHNEKLHDHRPKRDKKHVPASEPSEDGE